MIRFFRFPGRYIAVGHRVCDGLNRLTAAILTDTTTTDDTVKIVTLLDLLREVNKNLDKFDTRIVSKRIEELGILKYNIETLRSTAT